MITGAAASITPSSPIRTADSHPAASQPDFDFCRQLIEEDLIPDDVRIQRPLGRATAGLAAMGAAMGLFREIGQVIQVGECNFRLDHPEFSQMTRGIGVLRTKGRAKCINI